VNTNTARNRRIRTALLELLKTEYPGALDLKALRFALDSLGYPMMEGTLTAHLRYLEEKGYAELTRRKGFGFDIAFASLTAAGWDLLDGLTHDKGVDEEL
jgi:hypothetical protein